MIASEWKKHLLAQAIFVQTFSCLRGRKAILAVFFCVFVSRLVVRREWSSTPVPEGWVQVVRGPHPKSVQWPRVSKDGSSNSNHVSLERPHSRAVGVSRTSMVAKGSHRHRRQGSGRRTPTRRQLWHKSEFPSSIAALRAVGDDDDTAPSFREALKKARQQAVPLST